MPGCSPKNLIVGQIDKLDVRIPTEIGNRQIFIRCREGEHVVHFVVSDPTGTA